MQTTLTINGTERTFDHADTVRVLENNGAVWFSCTCCRQGDYADRGLRHSRRCSDPVSRPVEVTASKPAATVTAPASTLSSSSLHAAAKRGDLRLHASDDEIVAAVAGKFVSMGDAMNQDF